MVNSWTSPWLLTMYDAIDKQISLSGKQGNEVGTMMTLLIDNPLNNGDMKSLWYPDYFQ